MAFQPPLCSDGRTESLDPQSDSGPGGTTFACHFTEPNPVLLLDEAVAHLDARRRAALFDELEALSLQAFLTGVDEALFETLKGRALGVRGGTLPRASPFWNTE